MSFKTVILNKLYYCRKIDFYRDNIGKEELEYLRRRNKNGDRKLQNLEMEELIKKRHTNSSKSSVTKLGFVSQLRY